MRAVVYDAPRRFSVREAPTPEPGRGELRVRVIQTGVCGTDFDLADYGLALEALRPDRTAHTVVVVP